MLVVIILVIVSISQTNSYRPINVQPITTINEPKTVGIMPEIEETPTTIPNKTVVLKSDKVLSRGGEITSTEDNMKTSTVLLAKLVQSEALSESYTNKVAVASVVLNRMEDSNATMEDIIYAKSQFSGINGNLFNQEPSEECMQAAKDALAGSKPVGDATYFVDLNIVKPSWIKNVKFVKRIDNHWFYKSI